MTREEAIDILTDIRDDVFAPMETEEMIVVDELERKALSMAIRSLEAWEKIKGELKRQIDHNLEVKEKFLVGSYTRIECQVTCTVLADVINIIDKHLKEIELN